MGLSKLFKTHKKSVRANEVQEIPHEGFFNAAKEGDIKKVQEYIDNGMDVNIKSRSGESALYQAASKGHIAVVKLLIDNKADVNSENIHHETGIFYACRNAYPEVVKVLIDNGGQVNTKEKGGNTPLMYTAKAAKEQYQLAKMFGSTATPEEIAPYIEVMKILIEKGADMDSKNNEGESVSIFAEKHSLALIINFLKDAGAKQIDLSAFAPKAQIAITCDIKTVWTFLITEINWLKWHGSVPDVEPGWQEGATLVWPNGDKSTIDGFKPYQELVIQSTRIRRIIRLRTTNSISTLLEMTDVPSGGAAFSDGGTAHKLNMENCLMKFKNSIKGAKNNKC
ncbi:MAG: ankyrin repeat domain-containing protein [Methanosarcinaceae archaeon]|nr:ankyrin repeat domain-containing protein [Methanosarcinaceae archaeon]